MEYPKPHDTKKVLQDLLPYLMIILSIIIAFGGSLGHTLLSDDYVLIELSRLTSWEDLIRLLSPGGKHLYRPIPWLIFSLNYWLFGLAPLGWGLVNLGIHGTNSCLVYILSRRLLRRRDLSLMAGLVFSMHFIHAEPVIWASGVNTLVMTLLFLVSVLLYQRSNRRISAPSLATYLLAMLSKETAISLPAVILLLERFSGRRYCKVLPFVGVAILYVSIRSPSLLAPDPSSPYRLYVGVNLFKNCLFLLIASVLPLDFRRGLDIWKEYVSSGDGLTLLNSLMKQPDMVVALALVPLLYAVSYWKGGNSVRLGLLWMAVTFSPLLPVPGTGERFLYLPSVGFCIALAGAMRGLVFSLGEGTRGWATAAVVIVLVSFHLAHDVARTKRWNRAGQMVQRVIDDLNARDLEPGSSVYLLDLPDNYEGAWIFRNGFSSLGRLMWGNERRLVKVEKGQKLPHPLPQGSVVLRFRGGRLEEVNTEVRRGGAL